MNPIEFQRKWIGVELKERSASQEHFLDICRVIGHQTPAEMDPTGDSSRSNAVPPKRWVATAGPLSGVGNTSPKNPKGHTRTW